MVKANQDVTMRVGERKDLEFPITDEDTVGTPPYSMTGLTAKWGMVLQDPDTGEFPTSPLNVEKSSANPGTGITLGDLNGTDDLATVHLFAADTSTLPPGEYHHQLTLFDGSNEEVFLATGTITLTPNLVNT